MPDTIDLRGVRCPSNYVRARLALDEIELGGELTILLDEGEPVSNVPRSLREDGDTVLAIDRRGDGFAVLVRRGEA